MSFEVYLINLGLALIIYFILKWKLKGSKSKHARIIIPFGGAIILAPIIYIGTMALLYFRIYGSVDKAKQTFFETTENQPRPYQIDTASLMLEVDRLSKTSNAEKPFSYTLTIERSGFEDVYTQYWYFNNDFELERIDYSWAGESFSGEGVYRLSNNRLISKIDTSREESYQESYTFYYSQLTDYGGLKYENFIRIDTNNIKTIKETRIKILFKADFKSEEKQVLKDISDHLLLINKLKSAARPIEKKVELKKIDSLKYSDYEFTETLTYKVDSLLFKELIKKIGE